MSEAKTYKVHGCKYVRVNFGTNYPEPRIDSAYKHYQHIENINELLIEQGYLPL